MSARTSPSHVALLRGINVGGKNKLPMRELVTIFEAAKCTDVRTYIQSGNVVFRAPATLAKRLPVQLADAIDKRFRFRVPVVLRTARELRAVADHNPFLRGGSEPSALHVAFLADRPPAAAVRRLDPERSPPDRFAVRGREIYLCCPNGMARTKLTNQYLDATLATTSTVRNWRTVLELVAMAAGRSG